MYRQQPPSDTPRLMYCRSLTMISILFYTNFLILLCCSLLFQSRIIFYFIYFDFFTSYDKTHGVMYLNIFNVNLSDEGCYKCHAQNCEGQATTTAFLVVKGTYTHTGKYVITSISALSDFRRVRLSPSMNIGL